MNQDTTYELAIKILEKVGGDISQPFESTYDVCIAILEKVGGDPTQQFNNIYDVIAAIIPLAGVYDPGCCVLEELNALYNGTFNPSAGFNGFSKANVNVPAGGSCKPEEIGNETIVENGKVKFTPSKGSVFSEMNVDVQVPLPALEERTTKEIVRNGNYTVGPTINPETSRPYDGMKLCDINVNIPEKTFITEEKTVEIIQNGQTIVDKSTDKDGMTKVTINTNVPVPKVQSKKVVNVSSNGTTIVKPDTAMPPFIPEDFDVMKEVEIRTDVRMPSIQDNKTIDITSNGTIEIFPDAPLIPYDAMSRVTANVNVPEKIFTTEEKTVEITQNGQTIVDKSTDKDGMTKVTINVDVKGESTKLSKCEVNYNGIYSAPQNEGFSQVTVNVPPNPQDLILFQRAGYDKIYGYGRLDRGYTYDEYKTNLKKDLDYSIKLFEGWDETRTSANSWMEGYNYVVYAPKINTSNVTAMAGMFSGCNILEVIPPLDVSKVDNMYNAFYDCYSLTTIGGFIGLKCDIDLIGSYKLTRESLINLFKYAAVVKGKKMMIGNSNLEKLTAEDKAIATNKGWELR